MKGIEFQRHVCVKNAPKHQNQCCRDVFYSVGDHLKHSSLAGAETYYNQVQVD